MRLVRLLGLKADLGVKKNRKVDADFQAAIEEQNWYSNLSVRSNSD